MKILKFIALLLIVATYLSCKKDKNLKDEKCLCVQYRNQECLKYYQTAGTDPWGSWLQSNFKIEKGVKKFCESLGVKIISISIKDTRNRGGLIMQCECSKTGKIICVKIETKDALKLKEHDFIDN